MTTWHGTPEESDDLVNAIVRNCACLYGQRAERLRTCGPHQMLAEDQRALDGLVFIRRMAEQLRHNEYVA